MDTTQEQAHNMRQALADGYERRVYNKKERTSKVKLALSEGDFNLIHFLLKRIETGELQAKDGE